MSEERTTKKKGRNGSLLSVRANDGVSWQFYKRNGTNYRNEPHTP
jgi:hypothetical protein